MLASSLRRRACLMAALVLAGCHHGARPARTTTVPYGGQLITAEEIEKSGASNAWDVLRLKGVSIRLRESYPGQPMAVQSKRGHESLYLRDDPLVYVDGVLLTDLRVLREISAESIASIRQMSGIEATAYYGTNAGAGVILIVSKTRGGS